MNRSFGLAASRDHEKDGHRRPDAGEAQPEILHQPGKQRRQQEVLALRFGFGLPIKEVAETVNKSEGSVKMLQVRAIAALTRRLQGVGR